MDPPHCLPISLPTILPTNRAGITHLVDVGGNSIVVSTTALPLARTSRIESEGAQSSMKPRFTAIVTAWVRSRAPSFSMMCFICTFTVSSEI